MIKFNKERVEKLRKGEVNLLAYPITEEVKRLVSEAFPCDPCHVSEYIDSVDNRLGAGMLESDYWDFDVSGNVMPIDWFIEEEEKELTVREVIDWCIKEDVDLTIFRDGRLDCYDSVEDLRKGIRNTPKTMTAEEVLKEFNVMVEG